MGTLHDEMVADLAEMNSDMGYPLFTWQGADYPCNASVSQITRDLVEGGFVVDLLLTITVPRFDLSGNSTFPNDTLPEAQQKITFGGRSYRIESVKTDSVFNSSGGVTSTTGAKVRIIAVGITRGL